MKKKIKRTSLKDIADRVGVSTALVSYVLSGKEKEKRVGKEVAKRIREVVKELNYSPNQIAQSLRKGSTKTIGLIVADIANPFFGVMARIIEDEANKYGYVVIIGSSDEDYQKSALLAGAMLNRQVDGFIIVPADGPYNYIQDLVNIGMPLVLLDRYITGINLNFVVLDNQNATYEAIKCFIEKGFKRIGMVAYKSGLMHMKYRVLGYMNAMKENGLKENIIIKEVRYSKIKADMDNAMKDFTQGERKVEAILFATNTLCISGMYYVIDHRIRVPEDLAIIGFDESEAFDFYNTPLTYVKQPVEEMAKESVKILLDQIEGSEKIAHIMLMPQLVMRQSCG